MRDQTEDVSDLIRRRETEMRKVGRNSLNSPHKSVGGTNTNVKDSCENQLLLLKEKP